MKNIFNKITEFHKKPGKPVSLVYTPIYPHQSCCVPGNVLEIMPFSSNYMYRYSLRINHVVSKSAPVTLGVVIQTQRD